MEIREHVQLSVYTTFRAGGPARYFAEVTSLEDLQEGISFSKEKNIPLYVIGGGSNVLFSDDGWPGLVLRIQMRGISWNMDGDIAEVIVGAGESWDTFVAETVEKDLWGLENLSGIPGTVGAAPVQNIGAYGVEVSSYIAWVEVFDMNSGKVQKLSPEQCAFGYRDSFFKTEEGKHFIITTVCFQLSKRGTPRVSYKDIARVVSGRTMEDISQRDIRDMVLSIRAGKFPDLSVVGTAGSFFKNPIISTEILTKVQEKFPEIPHFPTGEGQVKIPIAYIIERLGFKGHCDGNVCTHPTHALVVVAHSNATATDIVAFTKSIAQKVYEETSLVIEPEVTVVKENKS